MGLGGNEDFDHEGDGCDSRCWSTGNGPEEQRKETRGIEVLGHCIRNIKDNYG